MSNNPEDYELFHYGVKGMKWGVRRSQAQLDFSSGRKATAKFKNATRANNARMEKGEADYDKAISKIERSSASKREKRAAILKERSKFSKMESDAFDQEARLKTAARSARKSDRQTARQQLIDNNKANRANKPTSKKSAVIKTVLGGPAMAYGYESARNYGATRGQALTASLVGGAFGGKVYREANLFAQQSGLDRKIQSASAEIKKRFDD